MRQNGNLRLDDTTIVELKLNNVSNVEQYQAALQQNLSSIIVDKSYHSASIEMSA